MKYGNMFAFPIPLGWKKTIYSEKCDFPHFWKISDARMDTEKYRGFQGFHCIFTLWNCYKNVF